MFRITPVQIAIRLEIYRQRRPWPRFLVKLLFQIGQFWGTEFSSWRIRLFLRPDITVSVATVSDRREVFRSKNERAAENIIEALEEAMALRQL